LEALAQALDPLVARAPIGAPAFVHFAVGKTHDPPFAGLVGRHFTHARRRAKRMLFPTTDGELVVLVHLMTAGRLKYVKVGEAGPKTPAFQLVFEGGARLVLTEAGAKKRAGVWLLTPEEAEQELAHLGPEALGLGAERLAEICASESRRLHSLLRDQRVIAGIGRAWANEILHHAQLSPYELTREVVEALAASYPTLDAGPHRSLRTGCIRPPGATHKRGGHQELTMPLAAAYDALRRPNSPEILEEIRTHLRDEIAAWRTTRDAPQDPAHDPVPPPLGAPRALSTRLQAIAASGDYDRGRYGSPSEARQAVIAGAVAAGWALADVAVRLADGRWPGLAAMYARYSLAQRAVSLSEDWRRAHHFIVTDRKKQLSTSPDSHVHKSHTSPPLTHGGGPDAREAIPEHDHIRTWRTLLRAVELHRFPGRRGHLTRFVLRALGEAAHKSDSRHVAFGVRSLAVATGADYSAVAAVLRRLAAQPDGWVDLVEPARGEHADLYELTIPADLVDIASDLRWDRGKAQALRPAFRELGHVAAFVFEALENNTATTITTLVPTTGLSRSAVAAAVDTLASYGLVDRSPTGLVARPDRLRAVAELVGALDAVTMQLRRYAYERQIWRSYLARHEPDCSRELEDLIEDYWWPPEEDAATWSLAGLVAA